MIYTHRQDRQNAEAAIHWTIGYGLSYMIITILMALVIIRALTSGPYFLNSEPIFDSRFFQIHVVASGAVLAFSLTMVPITILLGHRKITAGKQKDQQAAAEQEAATQRRLFRAGGLQRKAKAHPKVYNQHTMLDYLRERPTLTIWLKIAGWLSLFGILMTSPLAALLYYEYRVPQVIDPQLLTEPERFYHYTVTNLTMIDHWTGLFLVFIGYKAMTWLERQLDKPAKTKPQS